MDQKHVDRLQAHLKRTFGNPHFAVKVRPEDREVAKVELKGEPVGMISEDEDDDGSFMFEMSIRNPDRAAKGGAIEPSDVVFLEAHLKKVFGNAQVAVKARPKQRDSVEVELNGEFIGVIYEEEDEDGMFTLNMAILPEDLEV